MSLDIIVQLLQSAVCFGTVIMYGAIGEILTEKPVSLALEKLLDGEYTIEEPLEIRDL